MPEDEVEGADLCHCCRCWKWNLYLPTYAWTTTSK